MPDSQMTLMRDVPVVPAVSLHQHIPHGGPIWPGFDRQTGLRHCRDGVAVDTAPDLPAKPVETMPEAAVWGGCIDPHFGHFVAEHVPRLPFALRERPEDTYLFTIDPALHGAVPGWVWQVLEWLGLPRAQVRLVTAPLRAATLRAGVQGEMLPQVAPTPAYLDLIDGRSAALAPIKSDIAYVCRAGIVVGGGGGMAGEGYVISLLRRLGVSTLDPARADIPTQLATYAGAGHLIFAEGSALHGRQLIGRVAQRITVLRRRRGRSMARAMLKPRVSALQYIDVGSDALVPQWKNGLPRPDPALVLYDLAQLFSAFGTSGIELAALWDDDAYRAAVADDLSGWLEQRAPGPALRAGYAEQLAAAGFALPDHRSARTGSARPAVT
jgi:hypothetical protein